MERTKEPTILGEQSDDVWIGRKTTETARKIILNNLQLGSAMGIQVGNGTNAEIAVCADGLYGRLSRMR